MVLNNKTIKMTTKELTKTDWNNLIDYGLVDAEGNGFANTTKKADDLLNISSHRNTFVRLKGKRKLFNVRYYSGCFYPMWETVQTFTHNEIDLKNDINVIEK